MSNPVRVICTCASFGCAEQSVITESGILQQLSDVWRPESPTYGIGKELGGTLEQLKIRRKS